MPFPPFSPEEIERAQAYYGGTPGVDMSAPGMPPPTAPAPADYFGPPPPPPAAPPPNGTGFPSLADLGPPLPQGNPTLVDPPVAGRPPAPPWTPPPAAAQEAAPEAASAPSPAPMASPALAPAAPPRAGGGGDFGAGKARAFVRGTYDAEAAAIGKMSAAEQGKAVMTADRLDELARTKAEDAAIARAQAEEAERGFAEYRAETQRQIDAVRSKQIDGSRLFADSGSRVMAIVGGLLGGLYMGLNKMQSNPFIDQLNKTIDRDIAIQEKNLSTQKEAIAERRSLLGEMRASFKDKQLAELQARNLAYEGIVTEIEAAKARFDSPLVDARADQGIALVRREQGKLDVEAAAKKAAEARAAAAAKLAADQRRFENELKERAMRVQEGNLLVAAGKEAKASKSDHVQRFVSTGNDPETGNPTGFLARSKEDAEKVEETLRASKELLDNIDKALALRERQGFIGRMNQNGPIGEAMGLPQSDWVVQMKSIENDLGISWTKGKGGLGTYDAGIERLMTNLTGGLTTRGSNADVRLRELRERTIAARDRLIKANSGVAATKVVDPNTGEEAVVSSGRFAGAPNNPKTVKRERP